MKLKPLFTGSFYKKILVWYLILITITFMGIGYVHSYYHHKQSDFELTVIFPPWALYRGVEYFTRWNHDDTINPHAF